MWKTGWIFSWFKDLGTICHYGDLHQQRVGPVLLPLLGLSQPLPLFHIHAGLVKGKWGVTVGLITSFSSFHGLI